ncbi:MAG: hypothetical protein K9G26_06395 [Emcibacter sp.]|nr:hypothetical protein [Emcibacter sp.]
MINNKIQSSKATSELYQVRQSSERLRQTSEDLTKMARAYVATNDPTYKKNYLNVLAIRNDEVPRSYQYNDPYWNFITAREQNTSLTEKGISQIKFFNNKNMTKEEHNILKLIRQRSDKLIVLEEKAFEILEGKFSDAGGQLSLARKANPTLASASLYNAEYNKTKALTIQLITEFETITNNRIISKLKTYQALENKYFAITISLIVTTLIFSLLAYYFLKAKMINPIIALSDISKNILSSNLYKQDNIISKDEIGNIDHVINQALFESEKNYKRLFENAEVSIWNEDLSNLKITLEQLRSEGVQDIRPYLRDNPTVIQNMIDSVKILQINEATLKLFKATSNHTFLQHIETSFGPNAVEVFTNSLYAIWDKKPNFRNVAQYIALDGTMIDAIISYPIPEDVDDFRSIPVSIIDITEHNQLKERLLQSQKLEAIGELTGGIAHDFNNLLSIVIGNLDLMGHQIKDEGKLKKQLEKARNAALRGSTLIHRLLNFSDQSNDKIRPEDINSIIKNLEYLSDISLSQTINIEIILNEGLWMADIDTGDFEDMLINLCLNARDAMTDGGRLRIETENIILDKPTVDKDTELKAGEYIKITISDTGIGMSEEVASNIFVPFFTTKDKNKGTGLGLSMVYNFIQRSKGYITVHSQEGTGTTFHIYLPRSKFMARILN